MSWAFNEARERTRAGMWSWALKECHTVFCFELFLNSGATDTVFVTQRLKQQVCGTLVPRNSEVPTALTLLLVWRWSTASLVFPGRSVRKKERKKKKPLSAPRPPPPLPVPNKPFRFCGRKATSLLTYFRVNAPRVPFLAGFILCTKFGVKAVVYTLHKVWSEGGGLHFVLSLESVSYTHLTLPTRR